MKKTLLAAALMVGFAGVAQADTSVTLYGLVDGGIGYNKLKGSAVGGDADGNNWATTGRTDYDYKRTGLINGIQSGNRWGLKGSEDLGNGLRAVFQLESGFDLGTGESGQSKRLFGRHATLGLAGDSWGQLDFGRQTNIASKYLGSIDPFGLSFGQANMGTVFSAANTARYDNMVMYQSPNFSGFQFGVGYSFNVNGEQKYEYNGDESNTKAWTTGLRYANGPINVALTYDQFKDQNATDTFIGDNATTGGAGSVTAKSWNLGGTYDFEVVKLHLAGGQTRDGIFQGAGFAGENLMDRNFRGVDGLRINSYMAGLSAPVGAGNVMFSWTMADLDKAPNDMRDGTYEFKDQHTFSLGYTHPLSKRTNVYAVGSYAKNVHFAPDAKSTLVGVGLRHQF